MLQRLLGADARPRHFLPACWLLVMVLACWLLACVATHAQTVSAPTGQVPMSGVSFGTKGTTATAVDAGHPLPVTASSLPLPSGAATAAKQPALGTAGTPSTDVITVQGIASGTAQPVSGTFWQATQPVSGTFWQATQPVSGTFWQATQPVSQATAANLNATVVGPNTTGGTISGGFVAVGGYNGSTTAQMIYVDTVGQIMVSGRFANGTATNASPITVGGYDGANIRSLCTDTTGALCTPKAGTSQRVVTKTNLASNTSTTVCPAATNPISTELFFTVAGVGISLAGGTLTTATIGTTASTTPDLSFATASTVPYQLPVPATNAITAYGAAGIVVCIQNLRQ